jgi:hypothetical protein
MSALVTEGMLSVASFPYANWLPPEPANSRALKEDLLSVIAGQLKLSVRYKSALWQK